MVIRSIFLCLIFIIVYASLKKIYKKLNNINMIIFYSLGPFILFLLNIIDLNNLFLMGCLLIAWIQTTPALKSDIPSLIIYKTIFEKKNCSEKSLKSTIASLNLFDDKIDELILDNLIFEKNGTYNLTLKGRFIAKLFIFYRRLLKLRKGAG